MRTYGLISDIDCNVTETWNKKIFLTFDVDWAHDVVISDSAQIVESFGVRATWFFTHSSPLIQTLIKRGHEVGIHPNFNKILSQDSELNSKQVIDECLSWCPGARSTRSHSLVYGAPIAASLFSKHVTHSSNLNIPISSGIALKPWTSSNSIVEVPYSWADEHSWGELKQPSASRWAKQDGLLVADFHPIHVYLNSKSTNCYEESRSCHQQPENLIRYRDAGLGVRSELTSLCQMILN
jgi:hypothetical protein